MFSAVFTVEWGDCDEAGIVFYPNYFYWLDCTFQRFLRAKGLSQRELRRRFRAVTPLVDVGAQFRAPVRYDDEIRVEARVADWQERRFRLSYRILRGEELAVDGFEVRAWAAVDDHGRIKGAPIDEEFRRLLS
jgi:YbgC/YbaW family acyl-CoA thioester hydrolase